MSSGRRRPARGQGWFDLGGTGAAPGRPVRRIRRAAEVTLRQLRAAGVLERTDAAVVATYRELAGLAEDASADPAASTFNAVYALRAFLEAHDRLTRTLTPAAGELEGFLAGLTEPVTDDTGN